MPEGSISSPVKATLISLWYRVEDMERVISHVEHYVLAGDMSLVAVRWTLFSLAPLISLDVYSSLVVQPTRNLGTVRSGETLIRCI